MTLNETNIVHKHIVAVINSYPERTTHLPGGVWRGVAPQKAGYPHLVIAYAGGLDVLAFSGGYAGSGMEYLLKVVDASPSETRAVNSASWLEDILMENNLTNLTGLGYVSFDKLRPFNLPDVQDDITYQQVGRTYKVFVDPAGL